MGKVTTWLTAAAEVQQWTARRWAIAGDTVYVQEDGHTCDP